jgi:hypothetical protein
MLKEGILSSHSLRARSHLKRIFGLVPLLMNKNSICCLDHVNFRDREQVADIYFFFCLLFSFLLLCVWGCRWWRVSTGLRLKVSTSQEGSLKPLVPFTLGYFVSGMVFYFFA